jgi:hypothetical protein
MDNKLIRKQVGQKIYTIKKVVEEPVYKTDNEELLLIKNTVEKIILDNQRTSQITIKALSPVLVVCSENKIDEEYDELYLEKGSCVQFVKLNNIWYIIASDGIKLN